MLLRQPKLPVEFLSATSIAKFIRCPEQWRLRYLERQKDRVYEDRFIGLVDHAVAAEAFKFAINNQGDQMGSEWVGGLTRATFDVLLDKEQPEIAPEALESLKEQAVKMAVTYHEQAAQHVTPVAVEQRFEETIPGVPVPLIGYIDVIEPLQIIERKTSKTRLSKPKSEWRFQARLYQLVVDMPTEFHIITKQVTPQVCTAQTDPALFLPMQNKDVTVNMIRNAVTMIQDFYARWPDSPWPTSGMFGDWACDYCFAGPRYASNCVMWRSDEIPTLVAGQEDAGTQRQSN